MKTTSPPRKRVVWIVAVAALLIAAAATVLLVTRDTASRDTSDNNCAVVENVAREWVSLQHSVESSVESGAGEGGDLRSAADQESAMSDKLRAAANSVSSPAVRDQLTKWSEGVALTAQIQRGSVDRPLQVSPPPDLQAQIQRAAVLTGQATDALLKSCPNARASLQG